METFKKEFVTYTDPEIDDLYFGGLPAIGRYFSKKCKKISPGVFSVEVDVPRGELYYHFYYGNEFGNIILDPNNIQKGAKGWHSICRIGTYATLPVIFEETSSFISQINPDYYEIKTITSEGWIKDIHLQLYRNEQLEQELRLTPLFSHKQFTYYKILIPIDKLEKADSFIFKVHGKSNNYYLGKQKRLVKYPKERFQICDHVKQFHNLSYPSNSVIYHCFPDSFYRHSGSQTDRPLQDWGTSPRADSFFGGNLKGIIDKLGYLKTLGITHLYLTPIFEAKSNHRYDCINYKKIDPLLGTKDDFLQLVQSAHSRGIKIILDIVLNHCGIDYWPFQDLLHNQDKSDYKDWFIIDKFPIEIEPFNPNYKCWWNNGHMPEFNFDNPVTREHLIDICRYWIDEFNVDGWRIDVSSEMELDFLRELRSSLTNIKGDVIIIGENWKDARIFLEDNSTLCGVTNYLYWWQLFVPYFVDKNITLGTFAAFLMEISFKYPHNRLINSWNIISSHDIPRFISLLEDPNDIFLVSFLQIMLPGTPVIYYGDEIGLEGLDDPLNRACMNWDINFDKHKLFNWYQQLLFIFQNEPTLNEGHLSIIEADDLKQLLILKFIHPHSYLIYCAINLSSEDHKILSNVHQIDLDSSYIDLLTEETFSNEIELAPKQCRVLKSQ